MSNAEIEALEAKLADAKARYEARPQFPKWVEPDPSHVHKDIQGNISTPGFSEYSIDRITGKLSVLVQDEAGESRALAAEVVEAPAETPAKVA